MRDLLVKGQWLSSPHHLEVDIAELSSLAHWM